MKESVSRYNLRKLKPNNGSISNLYAHVFHYVSNGDYVDCYVFGYGYVILPNAYFI